MSAEATGWVYRHSPTAGSTLLVHLAIADSVSDQYDNRFWMSQGRLAEKTRLSRKTVGVCIAELQDEGLITCLNPTTTQPGQVQRFRFEMPDLDVLFESRARAKDLRTLTDEGANDLRTGVTDLRTNVRRDYAPRAKDLRTEPKRTQARSQKDPAGFPTCDGTEHDCPGPFCDVEAS